MKITKIKEFILFTFAMVLMIRNSRSATIGSKGMLASTPAIRNFLLVSGLGQKLNEQANLMYDLSGYQYLTEPVNRRPSKPSTLSHAVVEIVPHTMTTTRRRVRREAVSDQDKDIEKFFNAVRDMENQTSAYRLLCDIGSSPDSFGRIGRRIDHILKSVYVETWKVASSPYLEAFALGSKGGSKACHQLYGVYSNDIQKILPLLSTF